jgi:hypothetical protein
MKLTVTNALTESATGQNFKRIILAPPISLSRSQRLCPYHITGVTFASAPSGVFGDRQNGLQ